MIIIYVSRLSHLHQISRTVWITAVWRNDGSCFVSFDHFLQRFREVFEQSHSGRSAGEQLLVLSQNNNTAAEYTLAFRTLAAQTDWTKDTLKLLFRQGLSQALQSELACHDEGRSLKEFMDLTIQIDNLMRSRRHTRPAATTTLLSTNNSETLQLGYTHLTPEEREHRLQQHLCLYCGESGHYKSACPVLPTSSNSKAVSDLFQSFHCVKAPVKLLNGSKSIAAEGLIDSGAAGNFISKEFANKHNLSLTPCTSLPGLRHQSWGSHYGWSEGESSGGMAPATNCQGTTMFSGLCKFLSAVHQKFQPCRSTSNFHDSTKHKLSFLDYRGLPSFPRLKASLHHSAHTPSSRPQ